jgi:hypothetical protein
MKTQFHSEYFEHNGVVLVLKKTPIAMGCDGCYFNHGDSVPCQCPGEKKCWPGSNIYVPMRKHQH